MGRFLTGESCWSSLSGGGTGYGPFKMKAGASIDAQDAILLAADSMVYPIQTTSYAVAANMGTAIVAATTVCSGVSIPYDRQAMVVHHETGDIYYAAPDSGAYGLAIYQYGAAGDLKNIVSVWVGKAAAYDPHLAILSNGNIAATWSDGADLKIAVYDQNLLEVKAATLIGGLGSNKQHQMIALSGGGFMATWQMKTTTQYSRLAVYDNSGSVVTAPFSIATWSGAEGIVIARLAELSNQNVAIVFRSAYTATPGVYYGVIAPSGALVVAITATTDVSAPGSARPPELKAGTGFFAVAEYNVTSAKVEVRMYSNAGVQQGGTFQDAAGYGSGNELNERLVWDGEQFWLVNSQASTSVINLTKCPVSGIGYVTYSVGTLTAGGGHVDAFFERGLIVIVYAADTNGPVKLCVFNTLTLAQEVISQATAGSAAGTGHLRIIPGGDFSFVFGYYLTGASVMLVMKYADSAIIGIAEAPAVKGGDVFVHAAAGVYQCNAVKGGLTEPFDHTAADILGNRGIVLQSGGLVLKGMV